MAPEISHAGSSLRNVTRVATCTRCVSASFEFALTMKPVAISRLILKRNSKLPVARKCRFPRSGTCNPVLIQTAPRENGAYPFLPQFPTRYFAKNNPTGGQNSCKSAGKRSLALVRNAVVKFCLKSAFIHSLLYKGNIRPIGKLGRELKATTVLCRRR